MFYAMPVCLPMYATISIHNDLSLVILGVSYEGGFLLISESLPDPNLIIVYYM